MFGTIKRMIKQETVLCVAAVLAVLSMAAVPPSAEYLTYPDYKTLALLFCLMSVVAGLQSIGLFDRLGHLLLQKAGDVRRLGLLLIFVCFFSSMLITNDVALLTFVPFTILVYRMVGREERLIKIVTLETIAANLGSMATPVGNPQNIYLYSISGISLSRFFAAVLPYAGIAFLLLLSAVWSEKAATLSECMVNTEEEDNREIPKEKLAAYLVLFGICLLVVAHVLPWQAALAAVLLWMAAADRKLFRKPDYFLLLTFVCFFVFIGNMKRMEVLRLFLEQLIGGHELLTGIAASQVISNVPAAILLSGFTDQYQTLLTAVNLGGLGTLIASLASLISFKAYAKEYPEKKGQYLFCFTLWNVGFLAVLTAAAVWLGA